MDERAVAAALEVLDRHMAALNARSEAGLAATLQFPHFRPGCRSGKGRGATSPTSSRRAGEGWHHSAWDERKPIVAAADKVHLDVTFTRFRQDGSALGQYRSLWIVSRLEGRWAAQVCSSFAN